METDHDEEVSAQTIDRSENQRADETDQEHHQEWTFEAKIDRQVSEREYQAGDDRRCPPGTTHTPTSVLAKDQHQLNHEEGAAKELFEERIAEELPEERSDLGCRIDRSPLAPTDPRGVDGHLALPQEENPKLRGDPDADNKDDRAR